MVIDNEGRCKLWYAVCICYDRLKWWWCDGDVGHFEWPYQVTERKLEMMMARKPKKMYNFEVNFMPVHGLPLHCAWCRHQMETFSTLLALCAGNSPVHGEFPAQRPVTQSFGVFLDLRLNKWLSIQSWCWWFETLSGPLWRHSNG